MKAEEIFKFWYLLHDGILHNLLHVYQAQMRAISKTEYRILVKELLRSSTASIF